jgi:hypothetical protein
LKQQHFFQHCSAVWQPQGRFWQGNGSEESFSNRLEGGRATGSGKSIAQATNDKTKLTSLLARPKLNLRLSFITASR